MTKYILAPKDEKEVRETLSYVDSYLFGVKGFSTNFERYYTLEELKPCITELKKNQKEVFLSFNKNMHTSDLEPLKALLKECETLKVDGIFYYDISLVKLKKDGWFDLPLVWHQEHMTTNYETCNFWARRGVQMACLSSEITLEEMIEIKKNTKMELIVPIFGYLPMFVSKRNLVKNYIERFQLEERGEQYQIKKEGYTYPIVNDEMGTQVYSSHILNGMEESLLLEKENISYLLFYSFHIASECMVEVLKSYRSLTKENVLLEEEKIDQMLKGNTDKGFFYKETVFRVKKNEK